MIKFIFPDNMQIKSAQDFRSRFEKNRKTREMVSHTSKVGIDASANVAKRYEMHETGQDWSLRNVRVRVARST